MKTVLTRSSATVRGLGGAPSFPRHGKVAAVGGPGVEGDRSVAAEARLLVGLRRGDGAAHETLVRVYGPAMLATARRYVRSEADAEDVVQSAYVLVLRFLPTFAGASRLSTWLHRIVANCSLMLLRSRRRHPEVLLGALPAEPEFELRRPRQASPADVDELARHEEHADLRGALNLLPDPERTALRLHDLGGHTIAETAVLLGASYGAVKRNVQRGREGLRALVVRRRTPRHRALATPGAGQAPRANPEPPGLWLPSGSTRAHPLDLV